MSDLDVTIRLGAPPSFAVQQEVAESLRVAMRMERATRAEFVARLTREIGAPRPFAMITSETA